MSEPHYSRPETGTGAESSNSNGEMRMGSNNATRWTAAPPKIHAGHPVHPPERTSMGQKRTMATHAPHDKKRPRALRCSHGMNASSRPGISACNITSKYDAPQTSGMTCKFIKTHPTVHAAEAMHHRTETGKMLQEKKAVYSRHEKCSKKDMAAFEKTFHLAISSKASKGFPNFYAANC